MNLDDLAGKTTISIPEAASVLGIGRAGAYEAAKRGEIPTLKLGRTLRVPVGKLKAMLGETPVVTQDSVDVTDDDHQILEAAALIEVMAVRISQILERRGVR